MNDIFSLTGPYVIAHRGAKAYAPENTLPAFLLAAEQGAAGVELDAKLTKDGQVVVIHDQTLERTTNGTGRVVDKTLTELKTLDAGSFFSKNFQGTPIPTLDEVLEAVAGKLLVNIEITNYLTPDDELPEKITEVVKRQGAQNRVHFSSFHEPNLVKVKQMLPDCPVGLLTNPTFNGLWQNWQLAHASSPEFIHPYYLFTYRWWVQRQHRHGRRVHVWTVNGRKDMARLLSIGVDGIISDDPQLALNLIKTCAQ